MRTYKLKNRATGAEYDLGPYGTSMFVSPSGLGFKRTHVYSVESSVAVKASDDFEMDALTGSIVFRGTVAKTGESMLQDFLSFVSAASEERMNLQLWCTNSAGTCFCYVSVPSVTRGEPTANDLIAGVTFNRLSNWRSSAKTATISFSSSVSASASVASSGDLPGSFDFTLTWTAGNMTSLSVEAVSGTRKHSMKVSGAFGSAGTLTVISREEERSAMLGTANIYSWEDFSKESALLLEPGDWTITFTSDVPMTGTCKASFYDERRTC